MTSTAIKDQVHYSDWIQQQVEDPTSPLTKYITQEQHQEFFDEMMRINGLRYCCDDPITREEFVALRQANDEKYGWDNNILKIY